jgi:multidrug efflux pump subunit AcrA (membrane-fusion protein)
MLGGESRGRVLRAGLTDKDIIRVRVGDEATVQFDAMPGQRFSGRVALVGTSADVRTGTYLVEVSLDDAGALPSGLIGQLDIRTRERVASAVIPVEAMLEAHRDSAFVYTLSADAEPVATRQHVQILRLVGSDVAVIGLPIDRRVVTRGAPYVTDGMVVRIAENTP